MKFASFTTRFTYLALFILCGFTAAIPFTGCSESSTEPDQEEPFQILSVSAAGTSFSIEETTTDISVSPTIRVEFSTEVDETSASNNVQIVQSESGDVLSTRINLINNGKTVAISPEENFEHLTSYTLQISDQLVSATGAGFSGAVYSFRTENGTAEILSIRINDEDIPGQNVLRNVTYNKIQLEITFSDALNHQEFQNQIRITPDFSKNYNLSGDGIKLTVTANEPLDYYRHHEINITGDLKFQNGFLFNEYIGRFQTGLNPEYKFPEIPDTELLEKIQHATFGYFWDFAHPQSGMARERNTSGDLVTTGGSGFGLKAILVGIHRGFISRSDGIDRIEKIVGFLANADRFFGVWPHWMNGNTGQTIPFSQFDDGGDLVETAFMAQGLITVREYLDGNNPQENALINNINELLDTIEWDWYTRDGQNVLYWHWSENHGWQMNMPIRGYNEALIVYILAASSKNHSIEPVVYHEGWAQSGSIRNNNDYYGIHLPVGFAYGGPLFFAHYSFLGLDPRNLSDSYADYWIQNQNHTLINRQHNIVNPNNFVGYSSDSWGLTASDNFEGYLAHEPNRDNGTITPTAAISSLPYTPEESMQAIRHFYYVLGDKLWGEYGFHDAFNPTQGWWADSYLAIDQGPIIIMIENYRSGLLWDLFMQAPEVQSALNELQFTY